MIPPKAILTTTYLHTSKYRLDSTDFKDALVASLYSQIEVLRNELTEKNLLIRTLIIRCGENEIYENELRVNVLNRNDDSNESNGDISEITEISSNDMGNKRYIADGQFLNISHSSRINETRSVSNEEMD